MPLTYRRRASLVNGRARPSQELQASAGETRSGLSTKSLQSANICADCTAARIGPEVHMGGDGEVEASDMAAAPAPASRPTRRYTLGQEVIPPKVKSSQALRHNADLNRVVPGVLGAE